MSKRRKAITESGRKKRRNNYLRLERASIRVVIVPIDEVSLELSSISYITSSSLAHLRLYFGP